MPVISKKYFSALSPSVFYFIESSIHFGNHEVHLKPVEMVDLAE